MERTFEEVYKELKSKPYFRLCGCKIPSTNLFAPYFERLIKDLESAEIGEFMKALYGFIYEGKMYDWKTQRFKNIWEDILTNMNTRAESWFKKKETEELNKVIKDIMLD